MRWGYNILDEDSLVFATVGEVGRTRAEALLAGETFLMNEINRPGYRVEVFRRG